MQIGGIGVICSLTAEQLLSISCHSFGVSSVRVRVERKAVVAHFARTAHRFNTNIGIMQHAAGAAGSPVYSGVP